MNQLAVDRLVLVLALGCLGSAQAACGSGTATATPADAGTTPGEADGGPGDTGAPDAEIQPDAEPLLDLFVDPRNDGQQGTGTESDPYRDLQHAIDDAPDGATLHLVRGVYSAVPVTASEDFCCNCQVHATTVEFTRGFLVRGKSLHIVGEWPDAQGAVLITGAGYGLLVDDVPELVLEKLTITGGVRDPNGEASSGAVVVKNAHVKLDRVRIVANDSLRPNDEYPGIAGVVGREGAFIEVVGSLIDENSWDGVVMCRGARGVVVDTTVKRGNGVGLAAIWDGELTALNNRVSEYWKGIGAFGQSRVVAHNNQVFDNAGWGMWAAGDETSYFEIENNVIAYQGNCGLAVNQSPSVVARNNIIANNGRAREWVCPNTGLWLPSGSANLELAYNLIDGHPLAEIWSAGDQPTGSGGTETSSVYIGSSGNISGSPHFVGARDFELGAGSPAIDSGDPSLLDRDGTRSDMGHLGGPDAARTVLP